MKIKELHILSNNLPETKSFYNQKLQIVTAAQDNQSLSFMLGGTKLVFHHSEEKNPVYHFAIDIPHNQLDEAFEWMKSKVSILPVTAESKISELKHWNAKSFYLYDNNGNLLELIARADLPNASKEKFSSSAMLHVSEVGIVAKDVPKTVESLIKKHDLEIFEKQPPKDNFAVVGKETGLIVVVQEGRNWFPTEIPAKSFWSKTTFEIPNFELLTSS